MHATALLALILALPLALSLAPRSPRVLTRNHLHVGVWVYLLVPGEGAHLLAEVPGETQACLPLPAAEGRALLAARPVEGPAVWVSATVDLDARASWVWEVPGAQLETAPDLWRADTPCPVEERAVRVAAR